MLKAIAYQKQDVPVESASDEYPIFVPSVAVMISCADSSGRANITPIVAWSVVSRFPFMVAIGLCHGNYSENYFPRHSRAIISETREYVLNIPHAGLRDAVSKTGQYTGADPTIDKFALAGLTPGPAKTVKAPIIMECPINLECKVTDVVRTGSHDLFIAQVQAIQSDPIVSQVIEDDVMALNVLRPQESTSQMKQVRLLWRTLPDFVEPA
jgi:flavin reductase (DIM6/NTAB) family NADH-FMN oxidoreductase RutF